MSDEYSDKILSSFQYLDFIAWPHFYPISCQPTSKYPSLEGSSVGSNPSNEHPSSKLGSNQKSGNASPEQSIGRYSSVPRKPNCYPSRSRKEELDFVLGSSHQAVEKQFFKAQQKPERVQQYRSKNLVTERNRRNRIKEGLLALRALVPKISKMDKASIIDDAIDYIKELETNVKQLQADLGETTEEDCEKKEAKFEIPASNEVHVGTSLSGAEKKKQVQVQVEVKQIGAIDFLLKLTCEQKRGGFVRLMEAMTSLGLQVLDANMTTFNGSALNILSVKANKEVVKANHLKDLLMELTR